MNAAEPRPENLAATVLAPAQEHAIPLARALEHRLDMDEDDALAIAALVADVFGEAAEIRDEELDTEVRSIFYTLEAKKLLTFRREEYENEDGRTLRAYYWRIRQGELERLAREMAEEPEVGNVYDQLPRDAWSRRSPETAS